jgi:cytochrome c553
MAVKSFRRWGGLAIGMVISTSALAWNEPGGEKDIAMTLTPDTYRGMELFRICAKCHTGNGWGRRDGTIPQIAGQHYNVVVKQLADVRERNREVGNMEHFVGEVLGDTQALVDLAAYISELPMTPKNGRGPGKNLDHGEELYMDKCIGCHGDEGGGDNEKFYPRIQGQHYRYMLRQFRWIQAGERLNSHPDMQIRIDSFTKKDAQAVVDYISRLKPPKEDLAPSRKWRNPDFD